MRLNLEQFPATMTYDDFEDIFMSTLDHHAPEKKKTIRGNHAPFISQSLSKAIMHRSKLKNIYNKNPNDLNKFAYKKKRNLCVNLLRKEKKKHYDNLDLRLVGDNRKFWHTIRPLFSEKNKSSTNNIVLVENNIITTNEKEVAEKLNNYFVDSVDNLFIEPFVQDEYGDVGSNDEINEIKAKFRYHPSVIRIKEYVKPN